MEDHPNVKLNTFVDDMAQLMRGDVSKVAREAAIATKSLATRLQGGGFIISPKSALLTNSARTKHIVSSALKGIKVELKCVNSAPDLGLDRTADGSRPTGNGTKRSAKQKAAEEKAKRINRVR